MTPNYVYRATVKNVVDGDTLDLEIDMGFRCKSDHRVRLLRVDTFEMNARDLIERQKAIAARNLVVDRALGKSVMIQTVKADSFGRYLAEVWIDGVNLNDELLRDGLAVEYRG